MILAHPTGVLELGWPSKLSQLRQGGQAFVSILKQVDLGWGDKHEHSQGSLLS